MKKFRILSMIFVMVICFGLLVGCNKDNGSNNDKEDELTLESFIEMLSSDTANLQLDMTMKMSSVTVDVTMKIDENIFYMSSIMGMPEYYVEVLKDDNKAYMYYQEDGVWIKEETDVEDADITNEMGIQALKAEDFEYNEETGKYVYIHSTIADQELESLELEIAKDGKSATLIMSMNIDSMKYSYELEFSKFGEIELSLPKVDE